MAKQQQAPPQELRGDEPKQNQQQEQLERKKNPSKGVNLPILPSPPGPGNYVEVNEKLLNLSSSALLPPPAKPHRARHSDRDPSLQNKALRSLSFRASRFISPAATRLLADEILKRAYLLQPRADSGHDCRKGEEEDKNKKCKEKTITPTAAATSQETAKRSDHEQPSHHHRQQEKRHPQTIQSILAASGRSVKRRQRIYVRTFSMPSLGMGDLSDSDDEEFLFMDEDDTPTTTTEVFNDETSPRVAEGFSTPPRLRIKRSFSGSAVEGMGGINNVRPLASEGSLRGIEASASDSSADSSVIRHLLKSSTGTCTEISSPLPTSIIVVAQDVLREKNVDSTEDAEGGDGVQLASPPRIRKPSHISLDNNSSLTSFLCQPNSDDDALKFLASVGDVPSIFDISSIFTSSLSTKDCTSRSKSPRTHTIDEAAKRKMKKEKKAKKTENSSQLVALKSESIVTNGADDCFSCTEDSIELNDSNIANHSAKGIKQIKSASALADETKKKLMQSTNRLEKKKVRVEKVVEGNKETGFIRKFEEDDKQEVGSQPTRLKRESASEGKKAERFPTERTKAGIERVKAELRMKRRRSEKSVGSHIETGLVEEGEKRDDSSLKMRLEQKSLSGGKKMETRDDVSLAEHLKPGLKLKRPRGGKSVEGNIQAGMVQEGEKREEGVSQKTRLERRRSCGGKKTESCDDGLLTEHFKVGLHMTRPRGGKSVGGDVEAGMVQDRDKREDGVSQKTRERQTSGRGKKTESPEGLLNEHLKAGLEMKRQKGGRSVGGSIATGKVEEGEKREDGEKARLERRRSGGGKKPESRNDGSPTENAKTSRVGHKDEEFHKKSHSGHRRLQGPPGDLQTELMKDRRISAFLHTGKEIVVSATPRKNKKNEKNLSMERILLPSSKELVNLADKKLSSSDSQLCSTLEKDRSKPKSSKNLSTNASTPGMVPSSDKGKRAESPSQRKQLDAFTAELQSLIDGFRDDPRPRSEGELSIASTGHITNKVEKRNSVPGVATGQTSRSERRKSADSSSHKPIDAQSVRSAPPGSSRKEKKRDKSKHSVNSSLPRKRDLAASDGDVKVLAVGHASPHGGSKAKSQTLIKRSKSAPRLKGSSSHAKQATKRETGPDTATTNMKKSSEGSASWPMVHKEKVSHKTMPPLQLPL